MVFFREDPTKIDCRSTLAAAACKDVGSAKPVLGVKRVLSNTGIEITQKDGLMESNSIMSKKQRKLLKKELKYKEASLSKKDLKRALKKENKKSRESDFSINSLTVSNSKIFSSNAPSNTQGSAALLTASLGSKR